MTFSNDDILRQIKGWTTPKLTISEKRSYISFNAFDPITGMMKRKKIHLGRIHSKKELRATAERMIRELLSKLQNGWNPWIEQCTVLEYTLFTDVCDKYHDYLYKSLQNGDMRPQSVTSYLSYLNIFRQWATDNNIVYIYQLDKHHVSTFIDYVYITRNNSLQTRNNYLIWLKTFCHYLLNRAYISIDPTTGLTSIKKRGDKKRKTIPDEVLIRIKEYLVANNKNYLLACYLLHYCFIRPKEMSMLQIHDIDLSKKTLRISGDISKNRKDATITLPKHVIILMIENGLFDHPGNDYIFSDGFAPGPKRKSEKTFRDYWTNTLRRVLKFNSEYKFYSLKDTGITNMLRANTDILSVRDQARHSNISITDTYTPKDIQEANTLLLNYEGVL